MTSPSSSQKLLFVSTHTDQQTGYAKVAFNLLKQLQTLPINIYHFGFQRHPTFRREKLNIKQYDAAANEEPKEHGFGFNCFQDYLTLVNPDIILIYNDTSVVNKFLSLIPETQAKIFVYLDQVYKGVSLGDIPKRATKLFVFSEHWKLALPEDSKTTQHVLKHAPEPTTPFTKEEVLAHKQKLNLQDKTIFLNINRNSSRKRLDLTIQGFKLYHDKHPDSHLIIATTEQGCYNLPLIVYLEQLPTSAVTLINTEKPLTDEQINVLYNIADYGINTSDGEGCGLSTLQHASLHKPQLVLDIGSYRDFLSETTSVLLSPTIRTYIQNAGHGLFTESTLPHFIAKGLEELQTKSPPTVTDTWESVTEELKSICRELE